MFEKIKSDNNFVMKKFLSFIFFMFCIFFCVVNNSGIKTFLDSEEINKVIFYCEENNDLKNSLCVQNGGGYIIETDKKTAYENFDNIKGCFGVTIFFDNIQLEDILNNVNVVKQEKIGDCEIYYATAKNIIFSTYIENKKINLQIAVSNNKIIIGFPLILGSY